MSFRGRVSGGKVVFESPAVPPEGATVEVVVVSEPVTREPAVPTIAARYAPIVGILEVLPPDLAVHHSSHGSPRPGNA